MHELAPPPLELGVTLVHAREVGGEQRRLFAPGAGAHFEDGVPLVGLVLRQQQELHLALELGQSLLTAPELVGGQGAHLVLALGIVDEFREVRHLRL